MFLKRHAILLLLGLPACVDGLPEAPGNAAGFATSTAALTTAEYPLATWSASPNFDVMSRKPPDVTVIVIHTTEGTYASAINWFESTASQVSAHYLISKTGEITQMVLEKDKAWHVKAANSYTIGIEHEGMIEDPNWVTEPMLDASAQLCCYLLKKWQLPATKDHVMGHVDLPGQTHKDPGAYWPWDKYMTKVQACMGPVVPSCGTCDDKNPCTIDTCVAATCQHANAEGACDDGDACTVGDYCAQGLCLAGANTGCGADGAGSADADAAPDTAALDAKPASDADGGDPNQHIPYDATAQASDTAALAGDDAGSVAPAASAPQSAASGCQAGAGGNASPIALVALAILGLWRLARRRA